HCPHCGSAQVQRRIGRVAFHRGGDIESLLDNPDALDDLEKDPRALGKMMRMMKDELGEDLGPEFDEVVSRLEKGQSPEEIEQALPEFGGDDAGLGGDEGATADTKSNGDEA
ncbi:MAG: DUF1178 family protein, partial [Chloroflexi bacterium]|nr:DUF1178 family protein [Chloroflexota bacterium]